MKRLNPDAQQFIRDPDLINQLPTASRWVADNYNHLHEQPVLFYALMGYLFLTEQTGGLNEALAWSYVGFRVAHSVVQVTNNHVLTRFGLFSGGSLCLFGMTAHSLYTLL